MFGLQPSRSNLPDFLSRYLIFLMLFACWFLVRRLAFHLIEQRGKPQRKGKEVGRLAVLVIAALATMMFLQLIKLKVEYFEFVGILVILGLGGLRESLAKKALHNWSQLVSLTYVTGVSYISISLAIEVTTWQPAFLALGLACMVLAFEVLKFLEQNLDRYSFQRNGTPISKGSQLARAVPFLLACGPTFVASMAYMNELPKSFGAVFLTLWPSSRIITALKDAEKSGTLAQNLSQQASGISVLFIVIIALTSYLSI